MLNYFARYLLLRYMMNQDVFTNYYTQITVVEKEALCIFITNTINSLPICFLDLAFFIFIQ